MKFCRNERALSEVIGFILILVVVITAFSIYLIYAVPAQGREEEILHMNEIRDQFTVYKVGVDALWTNNQLNSAMSTTFNLGTQSGATQGSFSFIPIMNPVPSSGTLSINQRNETLIVASRGLMLGTAVVVTNQTNVPGSFPINVTPLQVIVNITDSSISTDLAKRYVQVRGEGQDWLVNVTVDPVTTYYEHVTCISTGCTYTDTYRYNRTDITIDVSKGGVMILQGYPVYQNIRSATRYSVNLLDDAYGLKNYIQYPTTISFPKIDPNNRITSIGIVNVSYEQEQEASHPVALGALEYNVVNNYWIPQTYYYQNGGVFLQQNDGTSIKLPPTITFSYNATTRIIGVKIVELPFQQTNAGNIGGNSPVQVRTQVTNIQNLSYSQTYNNTMWINLSIASSDSRAAAAWISALDTSANITAGVPREYYSKSVAGTTGHFNISGSDPTNTRYDIHAEGLRANLSATMQGG